MTRCLNSCTKLPSKWTYIVDEISDDAFQFVAVDVRHILQSKGSQEHVQMDHVILHQDWAESKQLMKIWKSDILLLIRRTENYFKKGKETKRKCIQFFRLF